MADVVPPKELPSLSIDVDRVLQKQQQVRVGGEGGLGSVHATFRSDSRILATLGRFGNPESRTLLFNPDGTFIVAETGYNIPFGKRTPIGRETVGGGRDISRSHARLTYDHNGRRIDFEDLGSTNGTEFFRATAASADGHTHEFAADERVVVVADIDRQARTLIGIGESSVISVFPVTGGDYAVVDMSESRRGQPQRLNTIREGTAITVGRRDSEIPAHLVGARVSLPDEGVSATHLRIFISDGRLYILNWAKQPFEVRVDPSVGTAQIPGAEPTVAPAAAPVAETPTGEPPRRRLTVELMLGLMDEIALLNRQGITDGEAQYQALVKKYGQAPESTDPYNRSRRMAVIRKLFGKAGPSS